MTLQDNTPRVYIASLADYNAGQLLGRWFELDDFTDADDLLHAIQGMLTIYDDTYGPLIGTKREEWAMHDAEHLPKRFVSESPDFAAIYEYLDAIADMDEDIATAYELFVNNGDDPSQFRDRYLGRYGDGYEYDDERVAADYAEQSWFEYHDEKEIPPSLKNYIDWHSMGRDLVLGGDVWISDGFVFRS
ncbi:hypothetical protein AUC43_15385 [Hymenobacter sedentarius]|uniref:Antirestriction protein n=1 Tax=Hymenobacter sedentarius TaxID=1411621 RepID=A0A0U4BRK9_9BACT|nr:antirestriction protein ArdA [Hymenobacter sedentarius]ALW86346.1 hypothetical protein AUC43_15385 [Hymenobacter sedentarius]